MNSYSGVSDARDYVRRAELVAKQGDFVAAFEDGWRLPGYPLFLSLFYYFSDSPLLVARYAQIILSALTILFLYLVLLNILDSGLKAILGATVIALWAPFYYFSSKLYAESCSIFLFSVFFFALSNLAYKKSLVSLYTLPILLALLVYLKPNHILMLIPLLAFLLFKNKEFNLWHLVGIVMLFIVMMAPWIVFVSAANNRIIPLSTTSGRNLYLGTGVAFDQPYEEGALHFITGDRLGLRDMRLTQQTQNDIQGMSRAEQSAYYTEVAKQIWISNPVKTTVYALSKILHSFGFSFRDFRDIVFVVFFLSSIVFSIYLWISNCYREWCIYFWSVLIVASFQTFVYVIAQRYIVVIFDIPALLIIMVGSFQFVDRFFLKEAVCIERTLQGG